MFFRNRYFYTFPLHLYTQLKREITDEFSGLGMS